MVILLNFAEEAESELNTTQASKATTKAKMSKTQAKGYKQEKMLTFFKISCKIKPHFDFLTKRSKTINQM